MPRSKRGSIRLTGLPSTKQVRGWWNKSNNLKDVYSSVPTQTRSRAAIETDVEISIAPVWTESDDVLCQFFGCTVLVILRERGDENY